MERIHKIRSVLKPCGVLGARTIVDFRDKSPGTKVVLEVISSEATREGYTKCAVPKPSRVLGARTFILVIFPWEHLQQCFGDESSGAKVALEVIFSEGMWDRYTTFFLYQNLVESWVTFVYFRGTHKKNLVLLERHSH